MADAMTIEAPVVVDAPPAGTTGGAQGATQAPALSKLYDQLPEATRKDIKAERFAPLAKLDNLVAEIVRLDGEVGNGIRVPKKEASKEEWTKYRKEIGIPDSPEGYALTKPQLPNGLPYNPTLEKFFRQELFDAGVPDAQAQKMFNDWNAMQTAAYVANQKAQEEQRVAFAKQADEALRAEFKDDFPQAMVAMSAALARFGGQKALDAIKQARLPNGVTLDNHPDFIRMFVEVGRRMDEDKMVAGDGGSAERAKALPRPGLPTSPSGLPLDFYPDMEKKYDGRYRVKAD